MGRIVISFRVEFFVIGHDVVSCVESSADGSVLWGGGNYASDAIIVRHGDIYNCRGLWGTDIFENRWIMLDD